MTGHLITTSCNSGTAGNWMDVFDTTAARLFWGYINSSCYSVGVDAWWMDAVEPECNQLTNQMTSMGPIEEFSNAYPLAHAKKHLRAPAGGIDCQARGEPDALVLRRAAAFRDDVLEPATSAAAT